MENLPKDYWKLSSRNFIGIGILLITSQVYLYMASSRVINQFGNDGKNLLIYEFITTSVLIVVMFVIGILFRKHNRFAVHLAYLFIGVLLVLNIINLNIVGVLLAVYVLYFVYKAQKSPEPTNSDRLS